MFLKKFHARCFLEQVIEFQLSQWLVVLVWGTSWRELSNVRVRELMRDVR